MSYKYTDDPTWKIIIVDIAQYFQRHAPAALPPGKTRYPLYRRLGGS